MNQDDKLKELASLLNSDQVDKLLEEAKKLKVDADRRCGNSKHYFYQTETAEGEAPEYGLVIDGHRKPIVKNGLFWRALLSDEVRNKMIAVLGQSVKPEAVNESGS